MKIEIKELMNVKWINIINPEKESLDKILKDNHLPFELNKAIAEPTLKTRAKFVNENIYVSPHFPVLHTNKAKEKVENFELDCVINKNIFLTSSYKHLPEFDLCFQNFENFFNEKKERENISVSPNLIFEYLLKHLYKHLSNQLETESLKIRELAEMIFSDERELELIKKTVEHKSILFEFKSILKIHKNLLQTYTEYERRIFKDRQDEEYIFNNEFTKLIYNLENQTEQLEEVRTTLDFLIEHKTKQFAKAFTIISFIILPLTFLASILGMNSKFPDELVQNPFATFYILICMFFLAITTTVFLKIKKYI
jgi:magnesium transporter